MKKIAIKFIVSFLLLGSLVTTGILNPIKAEAATPTVFWAHPNKAKELGYTFNTTTLINYQDLKNINKYFDGKDKNNSIVNGIATSIILAPLSPIASIPVGTAVSAITTYKKTTGTLVNDILLNSNLNDRFRVTVTYKYYRKGSNDGMYTLSNINIRKL